MTTWAMVAIIHVLAEMSIADIDNNINYVFFYDSLGNVQ